jgi:GT2 family glycosyltransferase
MSRPKYSIIIPSMNHLDDCLKPCIESIIKWTDLSNCEVIVVLNGCTDGSRDYMDSLPKDIFKTIWVKDPFGYTGSTNLGIQSALGDYLILLNNDTVLLDQPINQWIDMLERPFLEQQKVAITGPMLNFCQESKRNFLIFFCVMIPKHIIAEFGLLSMEFQPGFGEDTDYSIRVQEAGYKIIQVPDQGPLKADMNQERMTGNFRIFHQGEATLGVLPGGNELLDKNRKILREKWGNKKPNYEVVPQLHIMGEKHVHTDQYDHLMKLNLGCGDTLLEGYLNADLY